MDDVVINEPHSGMIYLFDGLDQPVTGEAGNITVTVTVDGVPKSKTVTITEVDNVNRKGEYKYDVTPDEKRRWYLHFKHSTYDPVGWEADLRVVDKLAEDIDLQNLGPGNRQVTVTVQDENTLAPIPGAFVEVYDQTLATRIAFAYTDGNGQVAWFTLYDGTYGVVISKIGQYMFDNPHTMVVSGDGSFTFEGEPFSPSQPPSPGICMVYGWEIDGTGTGLRVLVRAEAIATDYFLTTDPHIVRGQIEVYSDELNGGYWEMGLTQSDQYVSGNARYSFWINGVWMGNTTIPSVSAVAFADLPLLKE